MCRRSWIALLVRSQRTARGVLHCRASEHATLTAETQTALESHRNQKERDSNCAVAPQVHMVQPVDNRDTRSYLEQRGCPAVRAPEIVLPGLCKTLLAHVASLTSASWLYILGLPIISGSPKYMIHTP